MRTFIRAARSPLKVIAGELPPYTQKTAVNKLLFKSRFMETDTTQKQFYIPTGTRRKCKSQLLAEMGTKWQE